MSADNWRTHPDDFGLLARHGGLLIDEEPAVDLDPASNSGSQIPCRISMCGSGRGGPVCSMDYSVVPQTPVMVGGGLVNASGLGAPWPAEVTVFHNCPYSNPAPWVVQTVLHATAGGRGCALLPCNLPESAWTQAILLLAGAPRVVWALDGSAPATDSLAWDTAGVIGSRHSLANVLQPLFGARGVPLGLARHLHAVMENPPISTFGVYIPSRRLGFIDPDGVYKASNRQGTMGIIWGLPPGDMRTGVHTVLWPGREIAQSHRYPALAAYEREDG